MTALVNTDLSASLEDYLEAIFLIIRKKQAVRAKDIGEALKVGKASVTGALRALAGKGLINYAPYDVITLTEHGRDKAEDIVRRHEGLKNFFVRVLAVDKDEADASACRLEHEVSEEVLERFMSFMDYLEHSEKGKLIVSEFKKRCVSKDK